MVSGEAGQGLPSLVMEPFLHTLSGPPGLVPRSTASHPRPSSAEATSFHPCLPPPQLLPLSERPPALPRAGHPQSETPWKAQQPARLHPWSSLSLAPAWRWWGELLGPFPRQGRRRETGKAGWGSVSQFRAGPGPLLCEMSPEGRGRLWRLRRGRRGAGVAWEAAVCVRAAGVRRGRGESRAAPRGHAAAGLGGQGQRWRRAEGAAGRQGRSQLGGRGRGGPGSSRSAPGSRPLSRSARALRPPPRPADRDCSILLSQQGGSRDCPGREVWRPGHRWVCASALASSSASACPGVGAGCPGALERGSLGSDEGGW